MIPSVSVSLPLGHRGSKGVTGGRGVNKVGTGLRETSRVGCSIPGLEAAASDRVSANLGGLTGQT